jgi:hypothetical protein
MWTRLIRTLSILIIVVGAIGLSGANQSVRAAGGCAFCGPSCPQDLIGFCAQCGGGAPGSMCQVKSCEFEEITYPYTIVCISPQ